MQYTMHLGEGDSFTWRNSLEDVKYGAINFDIQIKLFIFPDSFPSINRKHNQTVLIFHGLIIFILFTFLKIVE